jgi:hypothetical protein
MRPSPWPSCPGPRSSAERLPLDRPIVYPQALAADTDYLNPARFAMTGLAELAQAVLGTGPLLVGLAATPGSGLTVSIGPGAIYQIGATDGTAYGSLGTDAVQILKQGLLLSSATLNCPAPGTSGQSINYLIQVQQEDVDAGSAVLQFYNPGGGAPFTGPNNTGSSSNTIRSSVANVRVKAGSAAATGSQTTPSVDSGFVAAYVATVTYGQTTIPSGNIVPAAGAPFLTQILPNCITVATADALIATAIAPLATTSQVNADIAPLATTAALNSAISTLEALLAADIAPLATTTALNAAVATINAALAVLAPLASPAFTGTPGVPTAAAGTNTTQAASTAFVKNAVGAAVDQGNVSSVTGPWWTWNPVTGEVHIRGQYNASITTEGAITVNFPINVGTFQTAQATTIQNSNTAATIAQVDSWTATTLTVFMQDNQGNNGASAQGFMWEVWGYSPTLPHA